MEIFYKFLCIVGLAKVDRFKTKLGSCIVKDEALYAAFNSPFVIYEELKNSGAPVILTPTKARPVIKDGYSIERCTSYAKAAVEFTWYREDYRYVLHPVLRVIGCK